MGLLPAIYFAMFASLFLAALLVLTKHWHGRFSMDESVGIQKMHISPTPRIGGVAIFFGVITAWSTANAEVANILGVLILAGLPAFVVGLTEDLTKKISVITRLLATMASGILGWLISGYSLTAVDIPILDSALAWMPLSVLFTAFAVGGVANAVNIIDGFNGLASGFVISALLGIGFLATLNGDSHLSIACISFAASMVGFWLINWPWGKIFLGDGGSYFGGFALAWLSVMLIERNDNITAFSALLICIHPVTEVLFSIFRRRIKKLSPGHPDRLHLHSLIMRRFVSHLLLKINNGNRQKMLAIRNPVTGLILIFISTPCILIAVWLSKKPVEAALFCFLFVIVYVTLYARLIQFHWYSPIAFLFLKPKIKVV